MYNRYIPQPDGSFHRRQYPDVSANGQTQPQPGAEKPNHSHQPESSNTTHPSTASSQSQCCRCRTCRHKKSPPDSHGSIAAFLKQLLPKDFDTGDLMVILLLLLMSSDCSEDQNTTLLTLALYLFL